MTSLPYDFRGGLKQSPPRSRSGSLYIHPGIASLLLTLLLAGLALTACGPTGMPREAVDPDQQTIYYNGVVLTMEADPPTAEAIAIRGDSIEGVGTDEEMLALADEQTNLIDLGGRTLMPGFVDAHTHIFNDRGKMDLSLDEAQELALRNGITTLADMFVDRGTLKELQQFDADGFMRVRTSLYLVAADNCGRPQGDRYLDYPPTRVRGEMLRVNGVKIFADGGTCGEPAFSFEIEPGKGLGDLWFTQNELNELVSEAQTAGYQVAIHAVGDRANIEALTAIEFALDGEPNTYRHRIEHASVVPPEYIPKFGELDVTPVYFGEPFSCPEPFGLGVPEPYQAWDQPYASMRSTNLELHIAWSTDTPYGSEDPFVHLFGFVTREDLYQGQLCAPFPWHEDDKLPVDEALSIMTLQSAYALFREDEVGSLAPGKLADLIVISENPRTIDPEQLPYIKVLLTVVGGNSEYCDLDNTDLCPGFTNRVPVR
jgi:predicted amidohydrolase YtcJ